MKSWFLLLLLALLLIISGYQGSLGKLFAVTFVPDMVSVDTDTSTGGFNGNTTGSTA